MYLDPREIIEIIGECTGELRDCEVFRTAVVLREAESDNERSQAIRAELAKAACLECKGIYLKDLAAE